jgi:KipI family sensor histidine kinase inhibitor
VRLLGTYLRFGDAVDPEVNARVHAAARALEADAPPGVTDVVPSYATLYVEVDRDRLSARRLRAWLDGAAEHNAEEPGRTVRLPVRYDGADLEEVAAEAGLPVDEVARRHAAGRYRVYALGFAPGFPFLGEVDAAIRRPRKGQPRARVPAHAVALAGAQTGVYPLPSPGGWRLLGTALQAVYDPHRDPPVLVEPGDTVVFEPADGPAPAEPEPLELLPSEPAYPRLAVEAPGLLDLVVDAGRFRVGRFGLARAGALDAPAAALANRLVGNAPDAPLLELNVRGPTLRAVADAVVAFAGAGVAPQRNGAPLPSTTTVALRPGDVLRFPPAPRGARGYLALAGGIASERFLGSASVDLRGRIGRPLRAGDVLGAAEPRAARAGFAFRPYAFDGELRRARVVRIEPGPQADDEALAALTVAPYRLRFGDRTGLQLDGPEVPGGELLSEPTPLGGIQIPPGGRPLVLLHDRGSIGGYAKPAVVVPEDLPRLAQLRPGEALRFVLARRRRPSALRRQEP